MKKEYDFSKGVRGRFKRPAKIPKTLRLDREVLDYFMLIAEKSGVPYQTLINLALKQFAREGGTIFVTAPSYRKAA